MQESAELLDLIRGSSSSSSSSSTGGEGDPILLSIYERYRPEYNVSAVLIWAFGVFVAWISSYMSSSEIRRVSKAIEIQRELKVRMDTLDGNGGVARQTNNNGRRASLEVEEPSGDSADERTIYQSDNVSSASNAAIAAIAIQQSGGVSHQEESLELTAAHAAGFLVMASTSLLILFFFKIYNVVKIMYAFGCSGAFAQIIVHPGFIALCRKLQWDDPLKPLSWLSEAAVTRQTLRGGMKGHCMSCLFSVFGPTSMVDLASVGLSYGVGAIWLWVAFTIPHPDTVVFYWVVQNVFGTCMCMLFLETIKLNAIKVGAILLIVAFFYDIFFVFITPLLTKHGESIMVRSRICITFHSLLHFSSLFLAFIDRSMLLLAEAHRRRILLGARSTLSRLIVRVVILFLCCLQFLELATIKVGVPCWA
jgi:signal peptide peptidase-like protein 2B